MAHGVSAPRFFANAPKRVRTNRDRSTRVRGNRETKEEQPENDRSLACQPVGGANARTSTRRVSGTQGGGHFLSVILPRL
jgi:hypothetical protein